MIILNKKWESLIWIIVGVFLLAMVSLWIGALISNSRGLIEKYEDKLALDLLSLNSYKIIDKIDLSIVQDSEIFYLYKDITNPNDLRYEIKVWEYNSEYKYVNKYGYKINPLTYNKDFFLRYFYLKRVIENGEDRVFIKGLIKKAIR